MIAATYLACCVIFYVLFVRLKLVRRTRAFASVFHDAIGIISDKTLDDDEKEPLIRQAAMAAAKMSGKLIAGLGLVVLVSILPGVAAAGFDLVTMEGLTAFALKPAVLAATLVGMGGAELLRRRRNG